MKNKKMNKQNIFNFQSKPNYESDNFFISSSNELAHKILLTNDNPENCIFLNGPAKSGKSHLAKLWQKNNKAILKFVIGIMRVKKKKGCVYVFSFPYFKNI